MKNSVVIVIDCGATNVRAVAINENGKIEALYSMPNSTDPDPYFPSGLIWDIDKIWDKIV
jgi:L-fuculokinase